jgi:predicted nucleotidyltransferase
MTLDRRQALSPRHAPALAEPAVAVGPYDERMPALAQATLEEPEQALLNRLVAALRAAYGDDLYGVWLYGSRARGERTHDESDIDVMVITRSERSDERLIPLTWSVMDELSFGGTPVDVRQRSLAWIKDRREIDSFFLRDLDRDKIVLYGGS